MTVAKKESIMKKFGGGFNMKEIKLKRAPAEEFYRLKDEA